MTILTLARGLPGSGKSTFAQSLGCFHVEDDMFRIRDGKYFFNWQDGISPGMICELVTGTILKTGNDVVVSNAFVTMEEMNRYFLLARQTNAKVRVVKCTARWRPRHEMDRQVIEIMREQWEDYEGEEVWDGQ